MLKKTLLAAAMLLAGTAGAMADPVKIRVAWVVPVTNLPSILLEKPELMTHNGKTYQAELVRFQGTPPMITALAAGEIDIADLAYSSFALAIQNAGMDELRALADESEDGAHDYYSAPYMVLKDGPIKKVEDMKGHTVATVGAGAAVDIAMRAMLRKHGLEDKRDYNTIEAGFGNMKSLLMENKVDLISTALPFSLDPELNKVATNLFTAKDVLGPSQLVVFAAKKDYIDKNRAALVDFLEDSIRVWHWYQDPKNRKEAREIASKVSKQPVANFESWVFTDKDNYRDRNLRPDLDSLQRNIDTQLELGFLKKKIDVKAHADLSLVEEAAKRVQ